MRVVKMGITPLPLWVNRLVRCVVCGLKLRFQVGDPVSSYFVKGIDPHYKYVFICPACDNEVAFRESRGRGILETERYYKI